MPFLQRRELLEGERIHLPELLVRPFGRLQPLLLLGPDERPRPVTRILRVRRKLLALRRGRRRHQLLGAVLLGQAGRLDAELLQRLRLHLLHTQPLLGPEHLAPVHRVGEPVELALEVTAASPLGRQLPLALGLRGLGPAPLLLGPYDRDLDMGEQLASARRHGGGHRGLVAQPGPALLGAGARLTLGTGPPVQRVGPPGERLDAFLVGTGLEARLHLGLACVGTVGGEPVAYGGVGLLLDRGLLGDQQPFRQLLRLLRGPLQRLLRPGGRGGHPFGLPCRATGLAGQPPQLLGHSGLLPLSGAAPLPQLLGAGRALGPPCGCGALGRGEFLAAHGQLGQFGGGLVDGGLDLQQARGPGGPAVREVGAQDIALGGDRGQPGVGGDQLLRVLQGADDDHVPHQPPYGRHQFGGAPHQSGDGRRGGLPGGDGLTGLHRARRRRPRGRGVGDGTGCRDSRGGVLRPRGLAGHLSREAVAGLPQLLRGLRGHLSARRSARQQRRAPRVLLAQQADRVRRRGRARHRDGVGGRAQCGGHRDLVPGGHGEQLRDRSEQSGEPVPRAEQHPRAVLAPEAQRQRLVPCGDGRAAALRRGDRLTRRAEGRLRPGELPLGRLVLLRQFGVARVQPLDLGLELLVLLLGRDRPLLRLVP
ncbi:hypothetical protein EES40_06840 [Streptomyces sp. ADI93-02]|nr:hypothetical protein EES40_06840 [Streptomyces sp. ADI93-02]